MDTFDKDTSGLDVLITPSAEDACSDANAQADNRPRVIPKSKSYNMSEVAVRWGASSHHVKKQISEGMRMHKMPNGRWEITEEDLYAWEAHLEQEQKREQRKRTILTVVTIVIAVVLVAGAIVLFFSPLKEALTSTLSGSSITQAQSSVSAQTSPYSSLTSDFVFSDSNTRYIQESEISSLSEEQCMVARNEIAARHGRTFNDVDLQEYFNGKSWYSPTVSAEDYDATAPSFLNEYEQSNSALIREVENEKGFNQ